MSESDNKKKIIKDLAIVGNFQKIEKEYGSKNKDKCLEWVILTINSRHNNLDNHDTFSYLRR